MLADGDPGEATIVGEPAVKAHIWPHVDGPAVQQSDELSPNDSINELPFVVDAEVQAATVVLDTHLKLFHVLRCPADRLLNDFPSHFRTFPAAPPAVMPFHIFIRSDA